ncbi:MAG: SigE family RNA polymerase sigma factor [Nocardioidaceae bacterium]|nr:SigE family RNA polymerase sigma factor [Nocardioidaceae bacterium]
MQESFDAFVAARGSSLWRSAWLLTGDSGLAEDLVQTALAKAWPRFEKVSKRGSFEAYVRRTMFTTYATWWRRKWRGEQPTQTLPDRETAEPHESQSAAIRLDVQTALATLSPGQRAVVVLRYFDDLTETETANQLGCSLGTVKTHHARAIRALRGSPLLQMTEPEDAR